MICFDTPNTALKPCGHVLCEECASHIFSNGCPFCRDPITDLKPLSLEELRKVQSLRAESDDRDEILRKQRMDGESDLIAEKFCLKWKKDKHLIAVELLKRIAMRNLESNAFQEALKRTMRDGHRILMQEKEKEKERSFQKSMYLKDLEQRSKDMSEEYLQQNRRFEDIVALIPKEHERKRARAFFVSEMTQISVELQNMIKSGKLKDSEDEVHPHLLRGCLDLETKIYERFLKGKRLSNTNAHILANFRKDTEREYCKLCQLMESPNCRNLHGFMEFTESIRVTTDDNCPEIIENKPATGLCNRVCKIIMGTFFICHAKFD